MDIDTSKLVEMMEQNYGLSVSPVGDGNEVFDLSEVKVYTRYPDILEIKNYGKFARQIFKTDEDGRYSLVYCETDFLNQVELFQYMKNFEYIDVKDYELITSHGVIKNYYLYKLVPYTVQGKPVWL